MQVVEQVCVTTSQGSVWPVGTLCAQDLGLAAGTDKFWAAEARYSTQPSPGGPLFPQFGGNSRRKGKCLVRARGNVFKKFFDTQVTIGQDLV